MRFHGLIPSMRGALRILRAVHEAQPLAMKARAEIMPAQQCFYIISLDESRRYVTALWEKAIHLDALLS